MRSFAIEEPGSPVPALYATLHVAVCHLPNQTQQNHLEILRFCTFDLLLRLTLQRSQKVALSKSISTHLHIIQCSTQITYMIQLCVQCSFGEQENISMFSTCSELTPRAPIPDGSMERVMQPWLKWLWTYRTLLSWWTIRCLKHFSSKVPVAGHHSWKWSKV